MKYASLFFQYAAQYMKTRMAYRTDMFVEIGSDFLAQAVNFLFILLVFGHTTDISGWSRDEVIFMYGFFLVPFAVFGAFFNLWDFNDRYIVKGEMDRILTRPIHSLFQIVLERMELESLFGAVTGIAVMVYAASNLGLTFHWYDLFVFLLLVAGGTLAYGAIFILIASISFWSDSPTSIMPMMYNIGNYGRYPVNMYNGIIRFLLTWVIPFAFVGVYPAAYFLGREEWYVYSFLTPVVGTVFFLFALFMWNVGVTKYRGAGN